MGNFDLIINKLESFTKKFYGKQLIKGIILFITLGILLFLLITGVEFLFWLPTMARVVLFFGFVISLLVLSYFYIIKPIALLLKISKGIDRKQASILIGKHFPSVGDKLLNLLELSDSTEKTDLLLAAMEQKSSELRPLPFTDAIKYKESFKYAKYLSIPFVILLTVWLSGEITAFFSSYDRVVNYDIAYEPPAPFQFVLANEELNVLESQPLRIIVTTVGNVVPEKVFIVIYGKQMLMQRNNTEQFEYIIEPPITNFSFRFIANGVSSRNYNVSSVKVPALTDFRVNVDYPKYLGLAPSITSGTGNISVPEGSRLTWQVKGINTTKLHFISGKDTLAFKRINNDFSFSKVLENNLDYELASSNETLFNYEVLGYKIRVIKDEAPQIKVEQMVDSLRPNERYFSGLVTDDKKVSKVSLVYYESEKPTQEFRITLLEPGANLAEFYYTFPSGIQFKKGKSYSLYFEVTDNDALHGGKTIKSEVFDLESLSDKQLINKQLDVKESLIKGLDRSLEELKEQSKELKKINQVQKEQGALGYQDKEQIKQFLQEQLRQEELMEKFSQELKEGFQKNEDVQNNLLKERLERHELQAKKNQKLLKQLEKVADKIEKEELKKRLEELAKSQDSGKRNLEQLLELTKRYYVIEKAAQLSRELEELSEKQNALAKDDEILHNEKEEQQEINNDFKELWQELEELKRDSRALKKPLDLNFNSNEEVSIKEDQKDALMELSKQQENEELGPTNNDNDRANTKQKSAAQKIKQLSEQLRMSSSGGGGSTIVEDAEMLRQILDNLIIFSFKQEDLLERVNNNDVEVGGFTSTIKEQKELRRLFEHVDDSLFSLSLRQAELSEFVNDQITEVYYNLDKTLENVAENQIYQAASYQQYVLNASNALGEYLADMLDNMQQSMMSCSGGGQGDSQGFQLPDIIQSQGALNEKMQGKSGEKNGPGGSKGDKGSDSGLKGDIEKGENANQKGEKGGGNKGKLRADGNGKEGKNGGKEQMGGGLTSGGTGTGNMSEENLKEIYEIYQEQQTIRKNLEQQLRNIINTDDRQLAKKLTLQMEQFENELLENGITQRTVNRINIIQQQLLKLENAALKQGIKKERESNTSQKSYNAPIITRPDLLKDKTNEIEILNRQALPLRPDFQNKVKQYFGGSSQF